METHNTVIAVNTIVSVGSNVQEAKRPRIGKNDNIGYVAEEKPNVHHHATAKLKTKMSK